MARDGKKILAIRASPRKRSNTMALLEQLLAGARDEGAQTQVITPYKRHIGPCIACDGCYKDGRCVVKDDFQLVYELIVNCDAVVLSTPIYFGAVSAQVKPLIDRCQSRSTLPLKQGLTTCMPNCCTVGTMT